MAPLSDERDGAVAVLEPEEGDGVEADRDGDDEEPMRLATRVRRRWIARKRRLAPIRS